MKRPKSGEIPRARLPEHLDKAPLILSPGAVVGQVACDGDELQGVAADAVRLDQLSLTRVDLSQGSLKSLQAMDVILTECDLTGLNISNSDLLRMEFQKCRMTGCQANGAQLHSTLFAGCKLDWFAARYGELKGCLFQGCDLRNADFEGSTLRDVKFRDCNLSLASFHRCTMENVDLRSSELVDLQGADGLRGATIDHVQAVVLAPSMAQAIGLTISAEAELG